MKKNKVFSLTLFALIAFASAKTASSAPPPSALADAPAGTEISLEDFLCNLGQTTSIELPDSPPAPTSTEEICGACSQSFCVGRGVGFPCDYQYGELTWCIPYTLSSCVSGGKRCTCERDYA
jgi:hypothetical protein